MRSTQSKTEDILRKDVEAVGLELVKNGQWANTGTYVIERRDSLDPLLTIRYSFQDEYASFTFKPAFGVGNQNDGELHYVKTDEMQRRLIEPVRTILAGLAVKA
jgi:hypothetical protein